MNHAMAEKYLIELHSKSLKENVETYFKLFDRSEVFQHTLDVVAESQEICAQYGVDRTACEIGAYLHDLGRVVAEEELVVFCLENGYQVLPGERTAPALLHQIASRIIGEQVFGIRDEQVLSAVECHTTLKANPSDVELVVFLADKLSWKDVEHAVKVDAMRQCLEHSLECAALSYLRQLHENRYELKCYHPWSREAHSELSDKLADVYDDK